MASRTFGDVWAHMPSPIESMAILIGLAELSVFGLGAYANPSEFARGFGLPATAAATISPAASPATRAEVHPGAIQPEYKSDAQTSPVTASADAGRAQQGLVYAIASRNVHSGLVMLGLACYVRDRRALGVAFAAGVVTTISDALIVRTYGDTKMIWGHVFGTVGCLVGTYVLLF